MGCISGRRTPCQDAWHPETRARISGCHAHLEMRQPSQDAVGISRWVSSHFYCDPEIVMKQSDFGSCDFGKTFHHEIQSPISCTENHGDVSGPRSHRGNHDDVSDHDITARAHALAFLLHACRLPQPLSLHKHALLSRTGYHITGTRVPHNSLRIGMSTVSTIRGPLHAGG